jgi:hypothetical protein
VPVCVLSDLFMKFEYATRRAKRKAHGAKGSKRKESEH